MRYLIALDGSTHADWAFHTAIHTCNPIEDVIVLVSVAQITATTQVAYVAKALAASISAESPGSDCSFPFSLFFIPLLSDLAKLRNQVTADAEEKATAILKEYTRALRQLGIKHFRGVLATSTHIGMIICETAKRYSVDRIIVGTRGLSMVRDQNESFSWLTTD